MDHMEVVQCLVMFFFHPLTITPSAGGSFVLKKTDLHKGLFGEVGKKGVTQKRSHKGGSVMEVFHHVVFAIFVELASIIHPKNGRWVGWGRSN